MTNNNKEDDNNSYDDDTNLLMGKALDDLKNIMLSTKNTKPEISIMAAYQIATIRTVQVLLKERKYLRRFFETMVSELKKEESSKK